MDNTLWMEGLGAAMGRAFAAAGYDAALGKVGESNRPDLCEIQCNGAMAGAKQYEKAPMEIAQAVAAEIEKDETSPFSEVQVAPPGFLNLRVKESALADYLQAMQADARCLAKQSEEPQTIVLDYGGPNVAKPLHVGHLRSAVIGEAIKRIHSNDSVNDLFNHE